MSETGITNIRGKVWLRIPDAPDYEVSSDGEIRSKRGILKPATNRVTGYQHVLLGRNNCRYVHEIVLTTFSGPRPPRATASHLNGKRSDNRRDNLIWEGRPENNLRKKLHGTSNNGERHYAARLTQEQVREIRQTHTGKYGSATALARKFGVSDTTIRDILKGRTWA